MKWWTQFHGKVRCRFLDGFMILGTTAITELDIMLCRFDGPDSDI